MGKILTNTTGALEHYLSMKYSADDLPVAATLSITGAATLSSVVPGTLPTVGAGKKVFACVSSVTDLPTEMTITLTVSATPYTAKVKPYAGIDSLWIFTKADASTDIAALTAGAYTVSGGAAGVLIDVVVVDDSSWLDMGGNFNESLAFQRGAMTAPVARGWVATDHQKRIRVSNSWSVRQLYCSSLEGVSNLRGKTIMLKDEIKTDGGSTVKETVFVTGVQVATAAPAIGGGGGEAMVDSVDAGGSFRRAYTWLQDATSLTATT